MQIVGRTGIGELSRDDYTCEEELCKYLYKTINDYIDSLNLAIRAWNSGKLTNDVWVWFGSAKRLNGQIDGIIYVIKLVTGKEPDYITRLNQDPNFVNAGKLERQLEKQMVAEQSKMFQMAGYVEPLPSLLASWFMGPSYGQ